MDIEFDKVSNKEIIELYNKTKDFIDFLEKEKENLDWFNLLKSKYMKGT